MIKYIILLVCFFPFTSITLNGQTITRAIVGSASNTSDHFKQLDWSIGEVMVSEYSNTNTITHGLHQGHLIITNVDVIDKTIALEVYPNPVISSLNIFNALNGELSCTVIDMNGKKVYKGMLNNEDQIDFSNLYTGTYFLSFHYKNELIKTIKIIKAQ